MARIVAISWISSSRVARMRRRTLSMAMTMSSRLANTRAIATRPSLTMLTSRIITRVTAWPFLGRAGSAS